MDRMELLRRALIPSERRPVDIFVRVGGEMRPIDAEWMGVVRYEDADRQVGCVLGFYRMDGRWLTQIQRDTVEECLDEAAGLVGVGRDLWEVVDLDVPPNWTTNDLPPDFAPQVARDDT